MIELPQGLKDHVGQDVTSLAYCWTIRRTDGQVLGFTDHDQVLTIDSVAHDPQTGLNGTAAETELGMAISTMEVEGALRSDVIDGNELRAGKFNGAVVETRIVNWANPLQHVLLRKAKIGKVEIAGGAFRAELQSFSQALETRQGRLVRRSCDAELGDGRCRKVVSTGAYQAVGTIASLTTQSDFVVSGLTGFAAQWFDEGTIEWLTGAAAGAKSSVVRHDKNGSAVQISIWLPLDAVLAVGDSFRITAGCDKVFETCKVKFSNHLNYQGFPHLPGNDAVYTYVDGTGIFDGGALVS